MKITLSVSLKDQFRRLKFASTSLCVLNRPIQVYHFGFQKAIVHAKRINLWFQVIHHHIHVCDKTLQTKWLTLL